VPGCERLRGHLIWGSGFGLYNMLIFYIAYIYEDEAARVGEVPAAQRLRRHLLSGFGFRVWVMYIYIFIWNIYIWCIYICNIYIYGAYI